MTIANVQQAVRTFVFTDIVGSTRLWEKAPDAARTAVSRHNAIVAEQVLRHSGRIFKTVGDACCCVFADTQDAITAAIGIQCALDAEPWSSEVGHLRVRIAVHAGPAAEENGDYFGPVLNRIARLVAAAHGGQVLVSEAAANAVKSTDGNAFSLRSLGAHRLKDLAEAQRIFQVSAPQLHADFPQIASLDAHPNNLPSQISSFIGRERELTQLRTLLETQRLVTICGPGGIGKTRLALQLAADTVGRYNDGSWIVRLTDIDDGALVAQAIASVLGVEAPAEQTLLDTLVENLHDTQAFVLIDNAEHVLADAASVVRTMLDHCAGLRVLITSREPLHITGEQVVRIGPMLDDDAADLFAARAALVPSDTVVRDICKRLDDLPLAIELAAARVGTLTPQQLLERLDAMIPTLASKDPTQEQRHRTLQNTIQWSYRLLNPKEQRFFAWLAVFEGGFALEACEAVVWAGEEDDPAYALLDALVDKSFVAAEPAEDAMRYRLLEPLAEFASKQLRRSNDAHAARRLHFDYYRVLAARWGSWSSTQEEQQFLAVLAVELPNIRAALEWGFSQPDLSDAVTLLFDITHYWQQHANIDEARRWYTRALAFSSDQQTLTHAKLLRRAATLATIEDDYAAARSFTTAAHEIFEALGDAGGAAEATHNLAVIEHRSGSEDVAYTLYGQALEAFERNGHLSGTITATYNLALISTHRGDYAAALFHIGRGVQLCSAPEYAEKLSTFFSLRGELAMLQQEYGDAELWLGRALKMKHELQDRVDEAEVLRSIAVLAFRRANLEEAFEKAKTSMCITRDLHVPSQSIAGLEMFAVIESKRGRLDRARTLLGYADALRAQHGYVYNLMKELQPELDAIRAHPVTEVDGAPAAQIERVIDELCAD